MPSIAHLIHAYGLLVVAGTIGLEGIGFPVPGETALIVASVISGTKHELNIVAVIVTAAVASIVGRSVGYLIGRYFGYWLLLRYGSYIWINEARIKLGQYLFLRHGGKIVIVAQFIPVLRTVAGVMAGANRMPWPQFLLANVFGAFALGDLLRHRRLHAGPASRAPGRLGCDRAGHCHRHRPGHRRPFRARP